MRYFGIDRPMLALATLLALAAGMACPASSAPRPAPDIEAARFADRIAALHLPEPLIATGPTTAAEDAALLAAARSYEAQGSHDDDSALTEFLATWPHSAWRVAVLTNLGIEYRHHGYFSRALAVFAAAWHDGKAAEGRAAHALVDRAVGGLIELDSELGYRDRLAALLDEIGDRPIGGAATEMVQHGRETLWVMNTDPKHLYLCGPMALRMLLVAQHTSPDRVAFLDKVRASPMGTSLAEVAALAKTARLAYAPVFRSPDAPVPVPSIVHWRVGHFAAIVGMRDNRFEVRDPTFGPQSLWLTQSAIDAEASGYFLAPSGQLHGALWRPVGASEAGRVWGKGPTKKKRKGKNKNPQAKNKNPKKKKDCPLCDYDIGELAVSLTLSDQPVGYEPPKGPSAKVDITYNQREDVQPANFDFFNVGAKWTVNWLTYIQDDPNTPGASVMLYRPDGDSDFFIGYDEKTRSFEPYDEDASLLVLETRNPVRYRRYLRDGSVLTYAESDGSRVFPRHVFLSETTDPQGNTLRLDYDKVNGRVRLASLTDATGRKTRFSYGRPGASLLITRITDPFGRHADLGYDAKDRLASITDVIGLTSRFTYDAAGEVISLTTPYGTTRFAFGGTGNRRFVNVVDPLGYGEREESFQPTPVPFSEASVPALPGKANYAPYFNKYLNYRDGFYWNKHAYAVARCKPSGGCNYADARITHFTHDTNDINTEWNTIESTKEPLENRVWFNYPGQPICPASPNCGLGAAGSGTYDDPSATARVLDNGETQLTQIAYNGAGHPTRYIDPAGREIAVDYAPNEIDPVEVTRKTAHGPKPLARFTYDDRHRPLSYTDPAGRESRYTYNAAGQLLSATDPLGETTRYQYSAAGDLVRVINGDGKVSARFTYNGFDQVASYTDSEGWTVRYDYDAADRLTTKTYPDGTKEEYGYSRLDLVSYKDREGHLWKYAYDGDRRMISVSDPLGHVTKYAYWEDGTLKSLTDANGHTTSWDIDVESRPTSKHFADGTLTTYAYENTTSRLKYMTDALGQTKYYTYAVDDRPTGISYFAALNPTPNVAFTYDPYFPRLTAMTDGTGTTRYGYVPLGSPGALEVAAEQGPLPDGRIGYSYDALGRIVGRTVGGAAAETFRYDRIGRLVEHTDALGKFALSYLGETGQPAARRLVGGNVATSWSYLSNLGDRRLKSIVNTPGRSFDYTTTPEDLISRIVEKKSSRVLQQWSLGYDDAYRLLDARSSTGKGYGYSLDPGGNITAFGSPSGTATATYNRVNALTELSGKPFVYDAAGNLVSDGVRRYAWDAENRLIRVTRGRTRIGFSYDGRDRRVAIATTKGDRTSVARYLWCGSRICQSRSAPTAVARLYYDEGEVIPAAKTSLYYGPDQLGSVREAFAKSPVFSLAQQYDYDPYGDALKTPSDGPLADFRFAGMFYEPESGLYLTQYRAYDPRIGRWLSRDPLEEDANTNLYAYVEGNPVRMPDPQGLGGVGFGPGNTGEGGLQIGCCVSIGPGGVSIGLGPATLVNIPWNGKVQLPFLVMQSAIAQLRDAYNSLQGQLQTLQNMKCQNTPKFKQLQKILDQMAGIINSLMRDADTQYGQNYAGNNQFLGGNSGPGGTPVWGGDNGPLAW